MEQEGLLAVKDALNAFAACELPLFMNPFTEITLDGYADPPDEPDRNLDLSLNRARSVLNYLESILGDVFTFGVAEEIQEGNASYSMGRIRWRGHGEPVSPSPPKKGRSEPSDPQQRRCDVALELRVPGVGRETSIDWSLQGSAPVPRKEK